MSPDQTRRISASMAEVRRRIDDAAARAGRDPSEVTLLGATKGVEPALIKAAIDAGLNAVGENRVQELLRKIPLVGAEVRWDLIGALQRNKVRKVVGLVSLIHGVDSVELITAISAAAHERETTQEILIEVNVSGEVTKHGCQPDAAVDLAAAASEAPGVRLRGLMTIAAPGDPEDARRSFSLLRGLGDAIAARVDGSLELSMGMSDDLEVAVEEGSTIVRVGTAIFGARPAV